MSNLNLNNETVETLALRTKMEATECKINLLDKITGALMSGLLITVVVVLPILVH